jgi:hypothetical protein
MKKACTHMTHKNVITGRSRWAAVHIDKDRCVSYIQHLANVSREREKTSYFGWQNYMSLRASKL